MKTAQPIPENTSASLSSTDQLITVPQQTSLLKESISQLDCENPIESWLTLTYLKLSTTDARKSDKNCSERRRSTIPRVLHAQ